MAQIRGQFSNAAMVTAAIVITLQTLSTSFPVSAQETAAVVAPVKPTSTSVYKLDLGKEIDIGVWRKHAAKSDTPSGDTLFTPGWGSYGNFKLEKLPKHEFIRVRLDLVLVGHVDGTDAEEGPDNWSMQADNGPLLLLTNFRNQGDNERGFKDGIGQSYPDEYPAGFHPMRKSAKDVGKFGFEQDSTYELDLIFPHRSTDLKLEFQSGFRNGNKTESWALATMEVDTVSGAMPLGDKELADLWASLNGEDAIAANQAVMKLVAGGKPAQSYLKEKWDALGAEEKTVAAARAQGLEAQVAKLVEAADTKEFKDRVEARLALKKLHPDAIPLLEKTLAAKPQPSAGVKSALRAALKAIRKKTTTPGAAGNPQALLASRVAHAFRLLKYLEPQLTITKSSNTSPSSALVDGFVPERLTDVVVPCFVWLNSNGEKDEWVQYDFIEEKTFNSAEVMWFENQGWDKGTKLPANWSLDYKQGEIWKPVMPKGGVFPITYGKLDRVEFAPIKSKSIRLKAKSTKNRIGLVEFRLGEPKP